MSDIFSPSASHVTITQQRPDHTYELAVQVTPADPVIHVHFLSDKSVGRAINDLPANTKFQVWRLQGDTRREVTQWSPTSE